MVAAGLPTTELCGLPFARLDRQQVIDVVFTKLSRGDGGWLLTANLDHLRNYALNKDIRELYAQADLIVADGMPLLWAARLQGQNLPDRIAGADLVWLLAKRSAKEGRSIYLLGGNEGTAKRACQVLQARYPGLRIAGFSNPRVSSHSSLEDLDEIRKDIETVDPDIVYVALGAPKQERVISLLRGVLPSVWMIGVGISLSFVSGEIRRAPIWLQRSGFEWCHRMFQEPRRLAVRYLIKDLPFGLWLMAYVWSNRQR